MFNLNMRTINLAPDMDVQVRCEQCFISFSRVCCSGWPTRRRDIPEPTFRSSVATLRSCRCDGPSRARPPKVGQRSFFFFPILKFAAAEIRTMPKEQLEQPITLADFLQALAKTKSSVNPADIKKVFL